MPSLDTLWVSAEQWFTMLVILAITMFLMHVVQRMLKKKVDKSSRHMNVDPTQYNFISHAISGVIFFIGVGFAIYSVPALRAISVSLFAGAGILAIVVGFASQAALSNVVSGIMIVIFKPFRVGDWIDLGMETKGTVEDITLRHTVIRTRENKRIVIPNSVMSNEKIENANIKEEKICRHVEIGISYDADIDKATKIMRSEAKKHKFFFDNRTKEEKKNKEDPVRVEVIGFGDSSVILRAWVWAKTYDQGYRMHLQLNKSIKQRFDKEGVEIPFPYRTLVYKTDLQKRRKK